MNLGGIDWGFPNRRRSDSTCWVGRRPAWMGKPYSMDLRLRVVGAVEEGGLSRNEAARRFGIGISTAINWVRRFRETGSVAAGQMGGHKPKAIRGEHHLWLLERIKEKDFTIRGLVGELAERGLKVDYRSVWNFVHAEKQSFKKTVVASERDRPDVARRREQWRKYQGRIAPERLVLGAARPEVAGQGPAWPLADDDVSGRSAP